MVGAQQNVGPLHWAAHKEMEAIALFLIEHGGDVMLADKEGRTPLSMASPELASKMLSEQPVGVARTRVWLQAHLYACVKCV